MSSESFKNRSEGWFALAKIVALVAVAGWTVYEWDRTIFPKEDHERLIRAAQTRTDLEISDATMRIGVVGQSPDQLFVDRYLELPDENPDGEDPGGEALQESVLVPSAVSFQFTLKNKTTFPVRMSVKAVRFAATTIPSSGRLPQWPAAEALKLSEVLGPDFSSPRVVEAGGQAEIAGLHFLLIEWCCLGRIESNTRISEILITLELHGVDPSTSDLIAGAEKTKTIRLRSFFDSTSQLQDEQNVVSGPFSRTIASDGATPTVFDNDINLYQSLDSGRYPG